MPQIINLAQERIILGIDPGTNILGYGIVKMQNNEPQVIQYGVLQLAKLGDHALKLKKIFERISALIQEYTPDEMALEAAFYGSNVQSMLKLGRVQGVVMAAALSRDIPIIEYAAKKIKQAVTGNGNASKEQVAAMLVKQFNLKEVPEFLDATDAISVALCHAYQHHSGSGKKKGWKNFISDHPDRVLS
jgi:crossover junction endodeoxyribonuclease RuvC